MPAERLIDAEPYDRVDRQPVGGPVGGVGGIIPPSGPVSQYPGLVFRGGFWFDPANNQWYDGQYNKLPGDPRISRPGPITNNPGPRPTDGPIDPGSQPQAVVRPGPVATPGTPAFQQAQSGIPTAPTNYLPGTGGLPGQGEYRLANPMPGMPTTGIAPVQAHQAWSLRQGQTRDRAPDFKPWGRSMGEVSDIAYYGGAPTVKQQGGSGGMAGSPGQGRPDLVRGGVTLPTLLGRLQGMIPPQGPRPPRPGIGPGGSTPPLGWKPPRTPAAPRRPARPKADWVPSDSRQAIGAAGAPRSTNPLTEEQLQYLLRTQGQLLRGPA